MDKETITKVTTALTANALVGVLESACVTFSIYGEFLSKRGKFFSDFLQHPERELYSTTPFYSVPIRKKGGYRCAKRGVSLC